MWKHLFILILTIAPTFASECMLDESEILSLSYSGYRPSSHINFNRYEISLATKFADMAYKVQKPELYSRLVEEHNFDGYAISSFEGETGHTAVTNYFVTKSNIGFLAENENIVVIAFRGTTTKTDILTDLYIWNSWLQKERFNGNGKGKVHVGFNKTFESFKDVLTLKILESVRMGKKKFVFVGHSMGGALANLAALYFAQEARARSIHDLDIKLVTFNAPRVGSKNFAELIHELIGVQNVARFTNGEREGAALVLYGTLGFKHAGTNVVLTGGSLNKLSDHRMAYFLNGEAELAFALHNATPKKANGVKSQLALNKSSMYLRLYTLQNITLYGAQNVKGRFWKMLGY